MKSKYKNLINNTATSIKKNITNNSSKTLAEHRKLYDNFCKQNQKRWKDGFDALEMLIIICTEIGENFNRDYRPNAVKEKNLVFDLVVRHHARACLIGQEILCLLKSGFADGAHARWRTLHEVTVTAMFIKKHGQECAKRFYRYDIVESYKGMKQHKKYESRLQEKAPNDKEIKECKNRLDKILKEYGNDFKKPYAWAAQSLEKSKVNFSDIEKDVSLDHIRPYYKWASQNIHSDPKGINKKLALCETDYDILLVGQSNSGMTEPAHIMAISLCQITALLLTTEPTLEQIALISVVQKYEKDIGQLFLNVDKNKNN